MGVLIHDMRDILASVLNLLTANTVSQAKLARDFRNLIHPGRAQRTQQTCDLADLYVRRDYTGDFRIRIDGELRPRLQRPPLFEGCADQARWHRKRRQAISEALVTASTLWCPAECRDSVPRQFGQRFPRSPSHKPESQTGSGDQDTFALFA